MKLNFILLDSALELVPKEILNDPSVIKNAERRGKKPQDTILDISLHYHAMRKLKDWQKRGRPDIVHMAMIMILSEKEILGDFYIHTYYSRIIKVEKDMNPPKNYNRFIGLMEQLLKFGQIPPNSSRPLMKILNVKLSDIVKKYKPVLLSEDGSKIDPMHLCNENFLLGIGAFQHGDFSEEVKGIFTEQYSISKRALETQQVVCRILSSCNYLLGWP
ncbi:16S rRNA methyltransferase [Acidianus hospitalis]|uniref:Ribosomal RNA small subunit methyltransferase Nep1 n=1 Tax=Acidianus hospitalis TaxID=563177 RepID=A0A2T9X8F7_9CREN|nr:16S rRNA methyltransferase [Acidianus hospitalis]